MKHRAHSLTPPPAAGRRPLCCTRRTKRSKRPSPISTPPGTPVPASTSRIPRAMQQLKQVPKPEHHDNQRNERREQLDGNVGHRFTNAPPTTTPQARAPTHSSASTPWSSVPDTITVCNVVVVGASVVVVVVVVSVCARATPGENISDDS